MCLCITLTNVANVEGFLGQKNKKKKKTVLTTPRKSGQHLFEAAGSEGGNRHEDISEVVSP